MLYDCRIIRNGIRDHLMDLQTLNHLEGCGSVNCSNVVLWQYRLTSGGEWSYLDGMLKGVASSTTINMVAIIMIINFFLNR